MKATEIYLKKYDWWVIIFTGVSPSDYNELMFVMSEMNMNPKHIKKSAEVIKKSEENSAFTSSNKRKGISIIGMTHPSSDAQFLNTIEHEIRHVVDHIASVEEIDPKGEEVGYITGEINGKLEPLIEKGICDCKECKK